MICPDCKGEGEIRMAGARDGQWAWLCMTCLGEGETADTPDIPDPDQEPEASEGFDHIPA